ncbi:DUF1624 domain-containing protein [Gammaproteobacteria bacterium]
MTVAKPLPPRTSAARVPAVDVVRGFSIVLMVSYHLCFDLNLYGLTAFRFNDAPFWLNLRGVIVSLFLGIMGVSLHLASRAGRHRDRYLRRLALIATCAGLVTVASHQIFPQSYIYFGVLHFVAVASVLALPFLRLDWGNLGGGLALIGLGNTVHLPFFDHPALHWVGMMTYKPFTEDYVPLVPWFGVVLLGLWLGRRLYGRHEAPARTLPHILSPLAAMGRHSLLVYMLHQPLLLGVLYLILRVHSFSII